MAVLGDISVLVRLNAGRLRTIEKLTPVYPGSRREGDRSHAVASLGTYALVEMPRANAADPHRWSLTQSIDVSVGAEQTKNSVYAMATAMTIVVQHFLWVALKDPESGTLVHRAVYTRADVQDLGEVDEQLRLRGGLVTLHGQLERFAGDGYEDHLI
jgi:anti-sigma factor RsiW